MRCPKPLSILTLFVVLAVGSGDARAQTVQLPNIRQFSYQGGVLVPDGGSTYLGGNRSYSSGSSRRGVPGLPSLPGSQIGQGITAGGASVTATIIDLDEMDRQILGYDPRAAKSQRRRTDRDLVDAKAVVAHAKRLVQKARVAYDGEELGRSASYYRDAISLLESSAASSTRSATSVSTPMVASSSNPAYLLTYARREFMQRFPQYRDVTLPNARVRDLTNTATGSRFQ